MDYLDLGSITDVRILPKKHSEDVYVLVFTGQLDTYNTTPVSKAFFRFLKEHHDDMKSLVLDLDGVHYVSSTGVGLIVEIFKQTKDYDIEMYLMNVVGGVMDVLNLLGFASLFNIIDNIEEVGNKKKHTFPINIACPNCGAKYKIIKSGAFRCSSCKHIFRVNKKGEVVEN